MADPTPAFSVDACFASLTKRQTMLLLTTLTFGGSEAIDALDFLAPDEAEVLKHRAQALVQIPREKRVPLLVSEIKRLVTAKRGLLWSADPEKLAQLLAKERRGLIEVVLRALPSALADEVRLHLPPGPDAVLTSEVKPEILDIVRWKLEEALARDGGNRVLFKFSDVALLQTRELLALCDRLGTRGLGTAIAGLPEEKRQAFLAPLPPDLRKTVERAIAAFADRALGPEDAEALIALHKGDEQPAEAIRSAGAQRLARACLAQSPEFSARVIEKHSGDLGKLLAHWSREERTRISKGADAGRTDIVAELERLEVKGLVDKPIRLPVSKPRPPAAAPERRAPVRAVVTGQRNERADRSERRSDRPERTERPDRSDPIAERGERSDRSRAKRAP